MSIYIMEVCGITNPGVWHLLHITPKAFKQKITLLTIIFQGFILFCAIIEKGKKGCQTT